MKNTIPEAKHQVMAALQAWRDSAETQQAMGDKPESYDTVIAFQARAFATATDADWLRWAQTARQHGAKRLAAALAMAGERIPPSSLT